MTSILSQLSHHTYCRKSSRSVIFLTHEANKTQPYTVCMKVTHLSQLPTNGLQEKENKHRRGRIRYKYSHLTSSSVIQIACLLAHWTEWGFAQVWSWDGPCALCHIWKWARLVRPAFFTVWVRASLGVTKQSRGSHAVVEPLLLHALSPGPAADFLPQGVRTNTILLYDLSKL